MEVGSGVEGEDLRAQDLDSPRQGGTRREEEVPEVQGVQEVHASVRGQGEDNLVAEGEDTLVEGQACHQGL